MVEARNINIMKTYIVVCVALLTYRYFVCVIEALVTNVLYNQSYLKC